MTGMPPGPGIRIARIALNVRDMGRAAAFYQHALGFTPLGAVRPATRERAALLGGPFESLTMALGDTRLELSRFLASSAPYPADSRANDLWFQHFAITCHDIAALAHRVTDCGGRPITRQGPQKLPSASGGVTAYKFRDPDGHPLELLAPADSPPPAPLQTPGSPPAWGYAIDHTALSVSDCRRAMAFYEGALGLSPGTQHTNIGLEQERLDDLPGARVRVVTLLAAPPGPHLELLAYEQPRGRRRALATTDIAATRTVLETADLAALEQRPAAHQQAPFRRVADAAMVRDEDGHWLLIEQVC